VKLATWNLERPTELRGLRKQRIQRVLSEINADIWVLTESVRTLPALSGFHAEHTHGADRPAEPDECWASVWSRYPIVERFTTSDPTRSVAIRVESPLGPLVVYATVLPWLGSPWREHPSADGVAFAAAVSSQLRDWQTLARDNSDAELIVAGDLNQDLSPKHYYGSRRNQRCLKNALEAAGLLALTAGEADPVPRHAPGRASIDHICAPIRATHWHSATRSSWPERPEPDSRLSDHFGVWIDVPAG
jgi:endonuclease/exonuclease/phosphatase family metal-dependent hydrolase